MPDKKHFDIINQGIEFWNQWRKNNLHIKPDLIDSVLSSKFLSGVNFNETNLVRANLKGANLSKAKLIAANLFDANLSNTNLIKANLNDANLVRVDLSGAELFEADLAGANLSGADISEANLSGADLSEANISGADLFRTNLHGANLYMANLIETNLSETNLSGVNLSRADLREANLTGADLRGANISQSVLNEAILDKATLINCRISGISTWNTQMNDMKNSGLIITNNDEIPIIVDDIQIAQFIYLFLNYENIRNTINILSSKIVLVIGHFPAERKDILNAIREKLHNYDYQPVFINISKTDNQNFLKSFFQLVKIAQFIIADFWDANILLEELPQILSTISVPIKPIQIEFSGKEYTKLSEIRKHSKLLLNIYMYKDINELMTCFKEKIIDPAEAAREFKIVH